MAAKKDVPPMTAFLYVPFKVIICDHNIRKRNYEVAKVFDAHPEFFKTHKDAEYNTLIIYVMYEMSLGDKSFWHPYFEIISQPDLPMMWTDEELNELQDAVLIRQIKQYREEFEEEWRLIYKCF